MFFANSQVPLNPIYNPGDILEVSVQKIVPRGLGLAFADGLTVFVSLAAPGDRVTVKLKEIKGQTAFAEIESFIEPSPERVTPPCKYFGTCGGCDFQQLSYNDQLAAKVGIIRDSLQRIGKIDWAEEIPIIPSPSPLKYRTRALWHVDTRQGRMGYFKRESHDVVDVDDCPILDPILNETLQGFRSELGTGQFWADKGVVEATLGSNGSVSVNSPDLLEKVDPVTVEAAGERYSFDARSFFQGNLSLVETLINTATAGAEGEHALDLYCGVGLFSLPLAHRFQTVTAVEGNGHAVEFARKNARDSGLENLRFLDENVGKFLASGNAGTIDFVLLDPPRAGTEKGVIYKIIRLQPKEISYVACDPSVLARDLRRLQEGGYSIDSITAIDLFPQTHHVETVARLSLSVPPA